jgi:uncharacterized protein
MLTNKKQQTRFHVMAKPIGPMCNLNCTYCFYLHKEKLLSSVNNWRMSDEVLEEFIRQYIHEQTSDEIVFSWQGGEPTLCGLNFFRKVVALERKYMGGKIIHNDLQTNGTLLDDEWFVFLKEHNFLVGLSIDGPRELHDRHRVTKGGKPTFDRVMHAVELLHKYDVPFNALVTLNYDNTKHPLDVYRFIRDGVQPRAIQLNACVEAKTFKEIAPPYWDSIEYPTLGDEAAKPGTPNSVVYDWSVDPDDYGTFLCAVFDEWYQNDIGKTFVYNFECAVALQMGIHGYMCVFDTICGKGMAIEHDGEIYSCDHFVYPKYHLGNIKERKLSTAVFSQQQKKFGYDKKYGLPQYCRDCEYLFMCHGECPKNRFIRSPIGEPGLNYLCSGLKKYFAHIKPYIKQMAAEAVAAQSITG